MDERKFLNDFLKTQDLLTHFLYDDFLNIEETDICLKSNILHKPQYYQQIIKWLSTDCEENQIYFAEDIFKIWNLILLLPKRFWKNEKRCFLFIGPFIFDNLANINTNLFSREIENLTDKKNLTEYLKKLRIIEERDLFHEQITSLLPSLFEEKMELNYVYFDYNLTDNLGITEENKPNFTLDNSNNFEDIKIRYSFENKMLECIKAGEAEKALYYLSRMETSRLPQRNSNPIRNHKNYSIVLNTILRKTVEQVKVHPFYIDKISGFYASEIEQATSVSQIEKISTEMIYEYSNLVKQRTLNEYSKLIQECILYIQAHFSEGLSLEFLADKHKISKNYLSYLFKKETGSTLTDFLNKTKVEHAKELIRTSNIDLGDLAEACGYESVNYFSRIFKKYTGFSPKEYIKKINQK